MLTLLKPISFAVKEEYFNQIKSGEKTEEYRKVSDYWIKRLIANDEPIEFSEVIITLGYPKKGDPEKTLKFPWRGWIKKTIIHPHFENKPTDVFAIQLSSKES